MSEEAHDHHDGEETLEFVDVALEGNVAVVFIDRPDKLNALNGEVLENLTAAFVTLDEEPDVGCVILTGSPEAKRPSFAAGADIKEMSEMGALMLRAYSQSGATLCGVIECMSKPVVAAINGLALGGGLELAMACHLRYAAAGARMGQPEVNLGIIPGFGGTQRLPRLVGRGRALEMLLTGDPVDAEEACRIGLVNKVLPDDELMNACVDLGRKLASKAPLATQLILDAVGRGADRELDSALEIETDLFGLIGTTEDVREGMSAFLEKRDAEWKGR